MGEWYIVSGVVDDDYKTYDCACIVFASNKDEARKKADAEICKNRDKYFVIYSTEVLNKKLSYCL